MDSFNGRTKLNRECVRTRWWIIAAVAVTASLPQLGANRPAVYALLAVWLVCNYVSGWASPALTARRGFFPVALALDSLGILAIIHFTGGIAGQFHLLYLAPILVASFHAGLLGGLGAATIASALFAAYATLSPAAVTGISLDVVVPLLTYAGMGLVSGLQGERMVRERGQLETVAGMSAAVVAEGTLGEALTVLCQRVAGLVSAEITVILLYEGRSLTAQWPAVGLSKMETAIFEVELPSNLESSSFFRGSWRPGRAAKQAAALEPYLHRFGLTSLLATPVATKGKVLGFFLAGNRAGGTPFNSHDEVLLQAAAGQAASAISNARLYAGLSQEKSRLEGILRNMGDAVIVVDHEGRVILTNPCAEANFGFSESLIRGLPLEEALSHAADPISLPDLKEALGRILRDRKIYQAETRVGTGPAEVSYQLTFAPMTDSAGEVVGGVAVFSEITQLKQVDRLKSEFVSTVSHELQTPLTAIKGYVETLLREDVRFAPERRRKFLDTISSETDRLINLVTNLLDLSRIEAGAAEYDFEPTNVGQLLEERAGYARPRTDKHRIEVDIEGGLPPARADRTMLAHVIDNLLANAIKYSPQGGLITLAARSEREGVAVTVTDQGMGIPPDRIPRIFGKFERGDSKEVSRIGGTGLGLFIAKSILEAHGGPISVRSEPGKGSAFTFRLARAHQSRLRRLAG